MITVDADVEDTDNLDKSSEKPSLTSTLEAYAKAQIALYNRETQIVLEKRLEELKAQLEHDGHPVEIFSLSVDFKSLQETTIKENMNRLPTSLQLSPTEVDQIEHVGRNVLRNNPQYRAFLAKTNGHLISTNPD
jgi:S-adenosylhomocysteine hydrolase